MTNKVSISCPSFTSMLAGIFFRPRRTLQAVVEHAGRGWWVPLLIMLALTIAMVVVSGPITARMTREQIAKMQGGQGISGSDASSDQFNQTLDFVISPVFTIVLPAVSSSVGLLISWVIQAGFFYLAVTVLGGHTHFRTLWGIVLWSAMPLALRALVQTIYIAATSNLVTNPGLSGLVKPPSSDPLAAIKMPTSQLALSTALGQIDVFVVWNLVLLIIGIAAAARFSHRKAALIVLIFWLAGVLLNAAIAVAGASLAGGSLG